MQRHEDARIYFESGRYSEAIHVLRTILNDSEYRVRSLKNISSCLMRLGKIRAALKFSDRALASNPNYAPALLNKAEILVAEDSPEQAIEQYRLAISADPSLDIAWRRQTEILCSLGREAEALKIANTWTARYPLSSLAHCTKGILSIICGNPKEAAISFRQAIKLDPKDDSAFEHLFSALSLLFLFDEALYCISKAAELNPKSFRIASQKGFLHWHLSQIEDARSAFSHAYKLEQTSAIAYLNLHLAMPAVPASRQEIESYHSSFLRGLSIAEQNNSLILDFNHVSVSHTFYLPYHNADIREHIERYIDLMRKISRPALANIISSREASSAQGIKHGKGRKVRIGLLSHNFGSHSNVLAFNGFISHLNRKKFHVVLIHTYGSKETLDRTQLDQCCDQSLQLSSNLAEIDFQLRLLDLNILYFTDLGMQPLEFMIPFLKTAPIQLTGWGVPHTSGIKEIDFYVSAENLQPKGEETKYTEQLVRLPGGLPCCFLADDLIVPPLSRDYFLLPPSDILIGCLQTAHKLHPDFDFILEEIAINNPNAIFVFTEDPITSRTQKLMQRLAGNAPVLSSRCVFLAWMSRHEYQSLCSCMDILLDPIYFGSGITFFEASLSGTPIVTMEGNDLRSRVVSSGYREMGIADPPISACKDGYVELVTDLVTNNERRLKMRSMILASNHRIFNRIDYVRNFEGFCIRALKERHVPSR